MTYDEKKSLYESIMTELSKRLKSMLNESDTVNDKERLENIVNNWDKLSPEAKNILSNAMDKVNNLNKSTGKSPKSSGSSSGTKPNSAKQFNVADAFIAPDTTILEDYVKSGNISKDFKTYSTWATNGLNKLESKLDAILIRKETPDTKSKVEQSIVDSFPMKYDFNESEFNEMFTVHTETFGDINIFDRQNQDELNLRVVYNMVKNFRIVQVLLKFIKKCVETDFNNDKYRTIVPLGHDKDLFAKFIKDNLHMELEELEQYKEVHNKIVYLYGENHHRYKVVEDIKFVDIFILLRYCLLSACNERKKRF